MSVYINNADKPRISNFFGIQKEIYFALENSPSLHQYDTVQELLFELRLRENIIKAARMLMGVRFNLHLLRLLDLILSFGKKQKMAIY